MWVSYNGDLPHIHAKLFCLTFIGVDLAGLLGGRMASAEGGSVPSGVGYGEGCPLSSRLRSLGSVVSSPSGVRPEPRPKTDFGVFWRPQNAHFCTYMTKSGGGTICISVSRSKFWATCLPCPPPLPWSTPMLTFIQTKKRSTSLSVVFSSMSSMTCLQSSGECDMTWRCAVQSRSRRRQQTHLSARLLWARKINIARWTKERPRLSIVLLVTCLCTRWSVGAELQSPRIVWLPCVLW